MATDRKTQYRAAAVCTPGLEAICTGELRALGLRPKPAGAGIVEFSASARQLYAANVWLRTANRVLVRLATFRATDFAHLQEHASGIDWPRWIPTGFAPRFRVTCTDSKLFHTKAIAQRLHQVSAPPSIGEPEQMFVVRIDRNTVTVSADSSGDALHHRPWRTELGAAPLRTTMASAALAAAEWTGSRPLIDPFCGSGTIAIEAALLARGRPPGGERTFAFQDWSGFEPGSWASVAGSIKSGRPAPGVDRDGVTDPARLSIGASDRDGDVVALAKRNAERAGVVDDIDFETRVVSHLGGRSGSGLILTNPPYGHRLGDGDPKGLYRRLGAVARDRLSGFDLAFLTSDPALARAADGGARSVVRFGHGGLSVALYSRPAAVVAAE